MGGQVDATKGRLRKRIEIEAALNVYLLLQLSTRGMYAERLSHASEAQHATILARKRTQNKHPTRGTRGHYKTRVINLWSLHIDGAWSPSLVCTSSLV